ncbi:MAG TPA: tetratricopeptide repeat protein, partial [Bryobacteraceae bacterium]|nr:tetratricopeptide repeat protein [Bryobacteraceae bacterium]
GYSKLLAMIQDYSKLMPTPEVIQKEFGMKPEEFDKQFLAWLDDQTSVTVKNFDQWRDGLKSVAESQRAKDWDAVIAKGLKIRDLYTDYVEAGSVYEFLAEAYINKDQKDKAMEQLALYAKVGGRSPGTLKRLAQLQTAAGQKEAAAATLERLTLIYLKDEDEHKQLGDLYMEMGRPSLAIREFQAEVAMGPIDKAGAHYELARALQAGNRIDEARDEVVTSLEAAPSFKPAQKLLLELETKKPEKK